MDLPTADKEQLAAFIVCFFCHCFDRVPPYCPSSVMSVYWLFGPPLSNRSSPLATISRTVSSNSCGDPAPQCPVPTVQVPPQTLFLGILPNPTRSRPLLLRGTALSLVSSLRPRVLVPQIPLRPLVLATQKPVSWLPRKRRSAPGMEKSTQSTSTQTRRSPVPPCYTLVCTTA